jgi:nicotinamide riboside kinase
MRIISITGPESSGKSEFAVYLSKRLKNAILCPEYARAYMEKHLPDGSYTKKDVIKMFREQVEVWDDLRMNNADYLILDGDVLIYAVWVDYVFGEKWNEIESYSIKHRPHITALCTPDLPWQPDPLRSNPTDRDILFQKYKNLILENQLPFIEIKGEGEKRFVSAFESICSALSIDESEYQ